MLRDLEFNLLLALGVSKTSMVQILSCYCNYRIITNLTSISLAFSMEPPRIQNPTFTLYLLNLSKKNKPNKNPYRNGIDPNNLANTIIKKKNLKKVINIFLHHIKLTQEMPKAMLIIFLTQ